MRLLTLLKSHPGKTIVTILWLVLFCSLLQRDFFIREAPVAKVQQTIARAEASEYHSLYFKKKKLGWIESIYRNENGLQGLHQTALFRLKSGKEVHEAGLDLDATFTDNNLLQEFFLKLKPFPLTVHGRVTGQDLNYTLTTAGTARQSSLHFHAPPRLTLSRRDWLLSGTLQPGDRQRLPGFDLLTLSGYDEEVEYHGRETVEVGGRMLRLHRFSHVTGGKNLSFWIDDQGTTFKEELPAGFTILRETKFKAREMPETAVELPPTLSLFASGLLSQIQDKTP
jgi:hypothetical protein